MPLLADSIPNYNPPKSFHPAAWIKNLAHELASRDDIDLHLITFARHISEIHIINKYNITFYILPRQTVYLRVVTLFKSELNILNNQIRRINPDIIHSHGTEEVYSYAAMLCGYPYIVSLQGIINELIKLIPQRLSVQYLLFKFFSKFEKNTLKKTHYIIAKTGFAEKIARKYNHKSVIYRIGNIVDDQFFAIENVPSENNYILFVGSISRSKGIYDLIDAVYLLDKMDMRFVIKMIGHANKEVTNEIKIRNLGHRFEFCGFLEHAQLIEHFKSAKMLVHPSHMDTSPNVISEAMAAGVPVLATDVGGIPDMIEHDVSGVLVPPHSPDKLAIHIEKLIINPNFFLRLAKTAKKQCIKQHASAVVVEKTVSAYKDILKRTMFKSTQTMWRKKIVQGA